MKLHILNTAMIPCCHTHNVSQKSHSIPGQFYDCECAGVEKKDVRGSLCVRNGVVLLAFINVGAALIVPHSSLLKAG